MEPRSRYGKRKVAGEPTTQPLRADVAVVGAGAAWTQGQIRTSYSTADRLARATGMTVLGSIPEMFTEAQDAVRKQRLRWFAGAAASLAGAYLLLLVVEFVQRGLMV